ncbi:hypothetical protein QTG56_00190 [Rossellomorea sp. AcN35-11]|nr:hypothetical protein QTG56_00190 [Rossellomorea sp. AcN35-11]
MRICLAFECAKLEGDEKQLGDISMGIGKAYLHQKNYVKAKSWTETCVGYYQQQSQKDQMAALFNLAAIERKLGNLDSFRDMLACCTWYARKRDPELFFKVSGGDSDLSLHSRRVLSHPTVLRKSP